MLVFPGGYKPGTNLVDGQNDHDLEAPDVRFGGVELIGVMPIGEVQISAGEECHSSIVHLCPRAAMLLTSL